MLTTNIKIYINLGNFINQVQNNSSIPLIQTTNGINTNLNVGDLASEEDVKDVTPSFISGSINTTDWVDKIVDNDNDSITSNL